MYWTSSIETNYGQLWQFYCENWGFNPLELRRCNLVSSHYYLLKIWLWPWIAPIDGNFISENDGQPDFSWGTTILDNPNPILLVISFYPPNIYPWYHDMAYNPLSLLLKHSPPNGKHGDLVLSLGGMLYWGAPYIPMKNPNNKHKTTRFQIWRNPLSVYKILPKLDFEAFP